MLFFFAVLLPLLFQLLSTLVVIMLTQGGGSFVGLGAMLGALIGIPATLIVNWTRNRRQPRPTGLRLLGDTVVTTAFCPLLMTALALLAS